MPEVEEASLEALFRPIEVAGMELRNRVMMTTHGPRLPQDRYLAYLDARSRDVALVGVHAGYGMGVFPPGPGPASSTGDDPDATPYHPLSREGRDAYERFVPLLREQGQVVARHGARCVGQLHHPGAGDQGDSLRAVSGPSPVADELRRRVPHPLGLAEIADLIGVFAEAAGRVRRAGLDAVEVHAGHGYLLQQFLSPLTNQRSDRYGGSLDNRMRLLLEVLDAVRAAVGDEIPVGVRIPGSEATEGGLTNEDMRAVAARLGAGGAAYLSVSNGTYSGLKRGLGLAYVASRYTAPGPSVADAAAIRAAIDVPVIVAGRIVDLSDAARIVEDGSADLVGLTRALIADPRILAKTRAGNRHLVDRCIACNECHTGLPVRCTVNPWAGRERELEITPAARPQRVVVVGGGPAGMQTAWVAAARGHRVSLFESEDRLGGTLGVLGADPARPELGELACRLAAAVERAGVEVRLGVRADFRRLTELEPDHVVVATGAEEAIPPVPGIELGHVMRASAVLRGDPVPRGHIVVVAGLEDHIGPLVTADRLLAMGRQVTLLTEQPAEGERAEPATRLELLRRLRSGGCRTLRLCALASVERSSVTVRDTLTNTTDVVEGVAAIVLAGSRVPRTALVDELEELRGVLGATPVVSVGDCLAPRRLIHAISDGTRVAVTL